VGGPVMVRTAPKEGLDFDTKLRSDDAKERCSDETMLRDDA